MNDHGDLTGSRGVGREVEGEAWVSRLGAKKAVDLPAPTIDGVELGGRSGTSVIRGITWFAPYGGVSVSGYTVAGAVSEGCGRATIWTCTQTYRH